MKQKLIIACVAVAIFSSCATHQGRNELPSSSPRAPEIQKSLDQTVIPEIDIENKSLEDALKAWHKASLGIRPQHFDFRYAISHPMIFSSQPVQQGVARSVPPAAAAPTPGRITVRRKNVTSARLLDEICQQSNTSWLIMGRVIVVRPSATASGTQP
ncbi:MAG: hypothetical protein ACLPT4_14255 [Verrucomicrobiia bacterium]